MINSFCNASILRGQEKSGELTFFLDIYIYENDAWNHGTLRLLRLYVAL